MPRILICRHGNTFDKGDIIRRVGARTDLPLSSSGRAQAEQLAAHLSGQFEFKTAYCSPLLRTRETAQAILKAHEAALTTLPFLTEIDYGVDEGKAEREVIARLGREAIALWDSTAVPPQGWQVDPDALRGAWAEFFKAHESYEDDILLVTSNGIARFVLDVVSGVSKDTPRKLRTAAFGVISLEAGEAKLLSWDARSA